MTTGQKIKGYRVMNRLSQEDLGKELGVHRVTVQRWEADSISPRLNELKAMARIFNLEYTDLVGESVGQLAKAV